MTRRILKYALYAVPLGAMLGLALVLLIDLSKQSPDSGNELPSVFIDKPAPAVSLAALDAKSQMFSSAELKSGRVSVVNFFASWCVPCRAEAQELQELSREPGIALYGIAYKDTPAKARAFLDEFGNPFSRIDIDADGRTGIDWGIQGVPETFVIDGRGIVRLRFEGPVVGDVLQQTILPAIRRAQAPG